MNIIHLLDNSGSKLSFSSEPLHIYIIFLKNQKYYKNEFLLCTLKKRKGIIKLFL